jgi:ribitol 2-dehydrogenase
VDGSLEGKVALVTGASSGIGLAIARELSRRGARVLLTARSAGRLEQAGTELSGPCRAVAADISEPGAAASVVDAAVDAFGTLDIVVANAGIYLAGEVWENDPDDIRRLLSTNVGGVVLTVRAALDVLLPRRTGDIVVTGSVSGYQAIHWEPVYSASKHALRAFVHGLRRQLVGTGVRVGEIAPGVVHTELWAAAGEPGAGKRAGATAGIGVGDVAEAVMFMLTRPRHVTVRDLVLLPSDQGI